MPFRTFRNRRSVLGKLELCEDLSWLPAAKPCGDQADIFLCGLSSQFLTGISSVSNQSRFFFGRFCILNGLTKIIYITARVGVVLIVCNNRTLLIDGLRDIR